MQSLSYYFKHPGRVAIGMLTCFGGFVPDKTYLKLLYRLKMGRKLNLKHPQSFSEKLQWLKLYDRKPIYTTMVDKYAVKDYVSKIIGPTYIIPTFGVWDKPEYIEWNCLPKQFVLKTTHDGGGCGVLICRNKDLFDKESAIIQLKKSYNNNIYSSLREWPYKNVQPRVIAEELLEDNSPHGLMDYKVFCCNGEPKMIKINYDVETNYHVNWYDLDWNRIEGSTIYDPTDKNVEIERPAILDEIIEKARLLSRGIPFLRVDFYYVKNNLLFGELTFFPGSGFEKFEPESFDYEIGSWINLHN